MVSPKERKHYFSNKDAMVELILWRITNKVSNKLGSMLKLLAEKYSNSARFRRYPIAELEDLRSYAVQTCLEVLGCFNVNRDKANPMAFFTQVIKNVYRGHLKKMYAELNMKEEIMIEEYHLQGKHFEAVRKKIVAEKQKEKEALGMDYFDNKKEF